MQGPLTLTFNFWQQESAGAPAGDTYVTEDGSQDYVTEDGSQSYVPET
jgi:hypothetical protein